MNLDDDEEVSDEVILEKKRKIFQEYRILIIKLNSNN